MKTRSALLSFSFKLTIDRPAKSPWTFRSFIHVAHVFTSILASGVLAQIKPYCPDEDAAELVKAAMLWKIFEATVCDLGLKVTDFASCTTDNELVMSMCANHAKYHGILSDWCISHLSNEASEQAFGISADPSKSKNKGARDIVRLLIQVVERLNKSATWREQLEGLQVKPTGSPLYLLY